jgi:hypothetical protein
MTTLPLLTVLLLNYFMMQVFAVGEDQVIFRLKDKEFELSSDFLLLMLVAKASDSDFIDITRTSCGRI